MAAELKRELSVEPRLKAAGGGLFEVTVDGKLLFSKKALKRFPADGEVVKLIRA